MPSASCTRCKVLLLWQDKHEITNRCVFRKKKKKTCLKLRSGASSRHRQTINKNNNYDTAFLGHILASWPQSRLTSSDIHKWVKRWQIKLPLLCLSSSFQMLCHHAQIWFIGHGMALNPRGHDCVKFWPRRRSSICYWMAKWEILLCSPGPAFRPVSQY